MEAKELVPQEPTTLVPPTKLPGPEIRDNVIPSPELRIDGSLRQWPYVFDRGEQMGKTLFEAPIYACHLIYSHNMGTLITDPVLRTALARFGTVEPKSPDSLSKDSDGESSTSHDETDSSLLTSTRPQDIRIALTLPEYPDYMLNFGRWNGHLLSSVPDSYAFWLIEQAVQKTWLGDPLLIGALSLLHRERFVDPDRNQASPRYQKIYGRRPHAWRFEDSATHQPYLLSRRQARDFFDLDAAHLEVLPRSKMLRTRSRKRGGGAKSVSAYELDDLWYVASVHKSPSGARRAVKNFLRSKGDSKALRGWKRER